MDTINFDRHVMNYRSVLTSKRLDSILLANFRMSEPNHYNYNLYYVSDLLGFFPWCFLILTKDDIRFWVNTGNVERARRQSLIERVEPLELGRGKNVPEKFAKVLAKHIKELIGRKKIKVGVDGGHLPSSIAISLVKEGIQLEDISLDFEKSRLVKDDGERRLLRRASEIVDRGVEKVMESIHEGMTERELSVLAESEMRRQGAECFWWPNIIASGTEAESWANSPTSRKIREGDLLWMDFTPVYKGYAADIARSFVYGDASEKQLRVFKLAESALNEAASTLRDGVKIREVMKNAAKIVRDSLYERYYIGPGHGIGLYNSVYPPFLTSLKNIEALPTSILEMELQKGMTIAIEIIFTVPDLGGVRLEDDYIITMNKPERLTKAPITATLKK